MASGTLWLTAKVAASTTDCGRQARGERRRAKSLWLRRRASVEKRRAPGLGGHQGAGRAPGRAVPPCPSVPCPGPHPPTPTPKSRAGLPHPQLPTPKGRAGPHLGDGVGRRPPQHRLRPVQRPWQAQQQAEVRELAQHHGGALPGGRAVQRRALGAVVKEPLQVADLPRGGWGVWFRSGFWSLLVSRLGGGAAAAGAWPAHGRRQRLAIGFVAAGFPRIDLPPRRAGPAALPPLARAPAQTPPQPPDQRAAHREHQQEQREGGPHVDVLPAVVPRAREARVEAEEGEGVEHVLVQGVVVAVDVVGHLG